MKLGQDGKQDFNKIICTLPYDEKSLRVYTPLDGPKLCVEKTSNKEECSSQKGSNEIIKEYSLDVYYAKASNLKGGAMLLKGWCRTNELKGTSLFIDELNYLIDLFVKPYQGTSPRRLVIGGNLMEQ